MKRKPIIGISSSTLTMENEFKRAHVGQGYIDSVIIGGGIPLIIPFNTNTSTTVEQIKHVDGLILSGGHDVFPLVYGEEPKKNLKEIHPERDYFDITLLKAAMELNKPIFGICRGLQIINAALGGTLHQDISLSEGTFIKHTQKTAGRFPTHTIIVEKDSFLEDIYGMENVVNSYHHQSINKLAPGFKITAMSKDNIIEGIEKIDENNFIIGVQWHPELMCETDEFSKKLFQKFIDFVQKNSETL